MGRSKGSYNILIPDALFAAVRDGDMSQVEAARRAGCSQELFHYRYKSFRSQQISQRTTKALAACAAYLRGCRSVGFQCEAIRDLRALWWEWHDEGGNLLSSPRRYWR